MFKRNNRSVELTEAGSYFYQSATRILHMVEKDVNITKKIHRGEIGALTIGFGGSVVYDLLPKIIKQVHLLYPGIQLEVRQLTTSEQVQALLNCSIDVGLLVPPIEEKGITTIPIREEPFVVCVPKNHRLAHEDFPVDIREFSKDPVIMTPKKSGKGYYHSVMSLCRLGGFYPNITQTAQEQQTIVSLVASELGIAFVPQTSKRIVHENVRYLSLKQQYSKITALAWNEEHYVPELDIFIELVKRYFVE